MEQSAVGRMSKQSPGPNGVFLMVFDCILYPSMQQTRSKLSALHFDPPTLEGQNHHFVARTRELGLSRKIQREKPQPPPALVSALSAGKTLTPRLLFLQLLSWLSQLGRPSHFPSSYGCSPSSNNSFTLPHLRLPHFPSQLLQLPPHSLSVATSTDQKKKKTLISSRKHSLTPRLPPPAGNIPDFGRKKSFPTPSAMHASPHPLPSRLPSSRRLNRLSPRLPQRCRRVRFREPLSRFQVSPRVPRGSEAVGLIVKSGLSCLDQPFSSLGASRFSWVCLDPTGSLNLKVPTRFSEFPLFRD
ncbi:hypothetical protein CRG98_010087 [Punica granatum]|uniref:Uncharacterized protein n=1 Tax=Punica granatum TaxID=22663 RepID=A0A2I0KLY3_PUNGR|nr:hypothetical protein CRG98_010087 [Punica granatum]